MYDLAEGDRSRFIAVPGQSGHPFSRHAADLLARWRDGKGFTIARDPPLVEATVQLQPPHGG